MRLDRIAIVLRMREPWEAVDLGTVMIRAWWRPVFAAWFAIALPVAAGLHLLFATSPWIALLALWWLKPVYDRVVLHVLSQAVFGSAPDVRSTLASLVPMLRSTGLVAALTWRRLDPLRAFNLPVRQLEGQRGREARARERLLGRRAAGQATGLLYACLTFELILVLSLNLCLDLVAPAGMGTGENAESSLAAVLGFGSDAPSDLMRSAFYFLALCVVEPLYVASGFSLYLNRRTALEAWDLELAFRRMQREPAPSSRAGAARLLVAAAFMSMMLSVSVDAWAASGPAKEPAQDTRAIIREVLAAPEFQEFEQRKVWRARDAAQAKENPSSHPVLMDVLMSIADALAQLSRIAAYALLAIVILLLVRHLIKSMRRWPTSGPDATSDRPRPQTVFGLDVRPESLPENLADLAARAATKNPRLALSLLYRGALATLIHRDRLPIDSGDTEGDCLRRVMGAQPPDLGAYFARLIEAWSQVAYASRDIDAVSVQRLCSDWSRYFGPTAGAST